MTVNEELQYIMRTLDGLLERVDKLIIADRSEDNRLGTLSDDLSTAHDSAKEAWKKRQ